jgi:hypothetical protein
LQCKKAREPRCRTTCEGLEHERATKHTQARRLLETGWSSELPDTETSNPPCIASNPSASQRILPSPPAANPTGPQNPRPMRPIRLPEPPGVDGMETPEIFSGGGGAATVVRRAVLIGNGSPGAENQCLGLARALGLADNLTLYVSSPSVPSRLLLPAPTISVLRIFLFRCRDEMAGVDALFRLLV